MANKSRQTANLVSSQTGIAVTISGDPVVLGVGNTEHVRVTGGGNIGIGSDNPQNKLDVAGDVKILDNSPRLFFYDANASGASNATGGFEVYDSNGNKNVFCLADAPNADNLLFGVIGEEKVRINHLGNIGVGTTGSDYKVTLLESPNNNKFISLLKSNNNQILKIEEDGDDNIVLDACDATGKFIFKNNGSETVRILNNGTIGINTTTTADSAQVEIIGSTDGVVNLDTTDGRGSMIRFKENGTSKVWVGCAEGLITGTDQDDLGLRATDNIVFRAGSDEKVRIRSDGELRVPGDGLTYVIRTGVTASDTYPSGERGILCFGGAANHFQYFIARNVADGTPCITNDISGTRYFEIEADGDMYNYSGTYGQISDAKLKENIVDAASQWDDIKALKVRNFNFISNPDAIQIGFVAQEVEEVSPGLVKTNIDRDSDDNVLETTTKVVKTSVLQVKAFKALQEAMARIEILESRLNSAGIATT